MKQRLTFLTFMLFLTANIFAQGPAKRINTVKTFGGYKFMQYGSALTMNEIGNIISVNPEAFRVYKKAKSNAGIAMVMGVVGGAMVGYPLGVALGGGDPEWSVAAIGAGVTVVGFTIASSASKKTKRAVEIYNSGISTSYLKSRERKLQFGFTASGAGLVLTF